MKTRMKRLLIIAVVISSFLTKPIWASELVRESKNPLAQNPAYVPGELLVKYKSSARAATSEYFRSRWEVSTLRSFKSIGVQHLKLPEGMTIEEALAIYRNDPDVEYAEPNYFRYAAANIPDDIFFSNLWGLDNAGDTDIDVPEAWDITTGNSNVVVAVMDSGVDYNHPDLAANIWQNPVEQAGDANSDGAPGVDGIDDDGDGLIDEDSQDRQPWDPGYTNDLVNDDDENGYNDDIRGWDFVDSDNNPIDSHDHGTHVAGTIAAVGNNNTGITGVSWSAKIMPLKFLDALGSGSVADEIAAIDYAINNGANIINASFGGYSATPPASERDAISRARAAGILFVAAVGNDNWDNDSATKHYPSSHDLDNIIAVAATDQNDFRASFSNFGPTTVDVAAPGTDIFSTRPDRQTVWSDNFEGAFGWTTGGTSNWGVTTEYSLSGSYSLTDSPNSDYAPATNSWAQTPAIDLSASAGSRLTFWWRGSSPLGDYFFVQGSTDGTNWTTLTLKIGNQTGQLWYGTASSFVEVIADLGPYDGSNTFYLAFNFQSNSDANVADGWYVDDVEITASDTTYSGGESDYQYLQGTSMATPHVSGLATLIWGLALGQTYAVIKERILNGVEVKSGLKETILTGGRINAYNSVRNVSASPTSLSVAAASSSQINLTWSDNSYGEDGFKIERKTGASGTYSQIAVTAANAISYTDTGLDESTTYYYRVRAYHGSNNSDFSTEVSATTSSSSGGVLSSRGGGGGGGCFIATAAYGSPMAKEVRVFERVRDEYLLGNELGRAFVSAYYKYSPRLADWIAKHPVMRKMVRIGLYPILGLSKWIVGEKPSE
jgi:subtilisin family serine protease